MKASVDLNFVTDLARRLPSYDLARISEALLEGAAGVGRLRVAAGSDILRDACTELTDALDVGSDPLIFAGAIMGAAAMASRLRSDVQTDVVWTGPASSVTTSRLTSEAIADVLNAARREILLVGYAVQNEARVTAALKAAADRAVEITLLLERSTDNPRYTGAGEVFPDLPARRLAWPAASRPSGGAALHAKVLVVDRRIALVGSANLTGWALERNLECGILIRGGPEPAAIHAHIESLLAEGDLQTV